MEPLTSGKYPHSMSSLVKHRLPKFTREQSIMIKGSYDFLGLNYYTASYVANAPLSSYNGSRLSYVLDWHGTYTSKHYGTKIVTYIYCHMCSPMLVFDHLL